MLSSKAWAAVKPRALAETLTLRSAHPTTRPGAWNAKYFGLCGSPIPFGDIERFKDDERSDLEP
jgi:hypothetical protein